METSFSDLNIIENKLKIIARALISKYEYSYFSSNQKLKNFRFNMEVCKLIT